MNTEDDIKKYHVMQERLQNWFELYKHLPKQGGVKWKNNRRFTIGGSEMYKMNTDEAELMSYKLGLTEFPDNILTLHGNTFETIIRNIVGYITRCDIREAPGLIPSRDIAGATYSADGIGIMKFIEYMITLFEFKCTFSREIVQDKIPDYYLPQVLTGMCNLHIPETAIYAEAAIKCCSLESIVANDTKFNTAIHRSYTPPSGVMVNGFIGIYFNNTGKDDESKYDNDATEERINTLTAYISKQYGDINGEYGDDDKTGDETKNSSDGKCYDWGTTRSLSMYETLLRCMKSPLIGKYNSCVNIYPPSFKHINYVTDNKIVIKKQKNNIIDEYNRFNDNNTKNLGVVPYKMFEMNIVNVDKDDTYMNQYANKISECTSFLRSTDGLTLEERQKKYNDRYNVSSLLDDYE